MTSLLTILADRFSDAILDTVEFRGERTVIVEQAKAGEILRYCHDELGFDYLIDVSSVDHFGVEPRWELVYELYALGNGARHHLRIKYKLPEDRKAESVSEVWPTAAWHEREIYDMMGIEFTGLADHRRILMWEGYPYFPLRKDFPLAGRPSEMPDVAFSDRAPLAGGPFVTSPTTASTVHREPRSREMD
ncbi:MAG: NADH-quinone oxidoreductase subunit C [Verrucomicrobiaceae bacterium]|nr:NADH-quinone oxidoreductase subunit C [Verrucomicrobiaceae bacterium]